MKKKIGLVILVFSLIFCSCGNKTEEDTDTENVTVESTVNESFETARIGGAINTPESIQDGEESTSEPAVKTTGSVQESETEDQYENGGSIGNSREELIAHALQEEEPRRTIPELYGAVEIIAYIGETGGKAYQGNYNGETYYMYLSAECSYSSGSHFYFTPYVTVVKEKDTSANPDEFGGRENFYGIILDETERFLDINSKYKFSYKGTDYEVGNYGNYLESDSSAGYSGLELQFISSTDIVYTFSEDYPDKGEIHFTVMEPDMAKYWYSQNALNGNFNNFVYYEGSYYDSYVRVEFTDGLNMQTLDDDYYMTVVSTNKDLDTFDQKEYHILSENYSYNEFSKLEDDEFMLEFISDRQAVLTNKLTGTSALVKYMKNYLTDKEGISDSQFYFFDDRINEREYTAEDGTVISFQPETGSWANAEDNTDMGERTVDIFYQGGGHTGLTAPVQVISGNTLRIREIGTNTDLLLVWEDDNHFTVNGTGDYLEEIDGLRFEYKQNSLYGY